VASLSVVAELLVTYVPRGLKYSYSALIPKKITGAVLHHDDFPGIAISSMLSSFYRATLCKRSICCCHVSVRLSVTSLYCTKMAQLRITQATS